MRIIFNLIGNSFVKKSGTVYSKLLCKKVKRILLKWVKDFYYLVIEENLVAFYLSLKKTKTIKSILLKE